MQEDAGIALDDWHWMFSLAARRAVWGPFGGLGGPEDVDDSHSTKDEKEQARINAANA